MNIALDIPKCELYVKKLEAVIQLTRRRLDYLCTGSQRCFGPILRERIVVVLHLSGVSEHTAPSYRAVLDLYLTSQVSHIRAFNMIRSGVYTSYKWMDTLQDVNDGTMAQARKWVEAIAALESADGAGLPDAADALQFALGQGADAIHLVSAYRLVMHWCFFGSQITDSICSGSLKVLCHRAEQWGGQVNTVSINQSDVSTISFLKDVWVPFDPVSPHCV